MTMKRISALGQNVAHPEHLHVKFAIRLQLTTVKKQIGYC